MKTMDKVKSIMKYIITFIGLIAVLLSLFAVTVRFIPREKIAENIEESIQYIESNTEVIEVKPTRKYSYLHVYADEILLNMIYCMDSNKPLESIMQSKYYERKIGQNTEVPSLEGAIQNNGEGNQEYIRYWHGSMLIVRPLLMFFNINQIYYIFAVIMIILAVVLLVILIKKKQILLLIATIVGYIMIAINYVPFCLEYVWTFIIMMVVSIVAILCKKRNLLFFISGMLTCFFDFLTTEIITLFVPIIYVYTIRYRNNEVTDILKEIKQIMLWIVLWGLGYASMWGAKWLIASIVLNINALDYVVDKAMIRINGPIENYSIIYVMIQGIIRNISTLYPFYMFKNTATVVCILIGIVVVTILLIKKDKKSIINFFIYFFIAISPYIRYIILANHSYKHYIFTFREQLITIMALIVGICVSIDKNKLKEEVKLRRKQ